MPLIKFSFNGNVADKISAAYKEAIISQYKKLISESPRAICYFTATWCGPCKMIAPHIDTIAAEEPKLTIIKIDIDEFADVAGVENISSVPTFNFYKDNKLINTVTGANKQKIVALAKELLS